ncbi:hypothetical protein A2U01_0061920, partial [Trifolium medium]|nr:hypothetical protein [Trifolium medium]
MPEPPAIIPNALTWP